MDEAFITLWVLLSIPLLGVALYPVNVLIGNIYRERRHRMVRDVLKEKLDVLATAVAMGYKEEELALLDARLEKLVGKQELEKLLKEERQMGLFRHSVTTRRESLADADLEATQAVLNVLKRRTREGDPDS